VIEKSKLFKVLLKAKLRLPVHYRKLRHSRNCPKICL